jgi:hypothetical protein
VLDERPTSKQAETDDSVAEYAAPAIVWEERFDLRSIAVACGKSTPTGDCIFGPLNS